MRSIASQPASPFADDMLFDAHAHVYTGDVARYPVNTRNSFHSEEELHRRIATNPITPERLLAEWDAQGVEAGAGVQYSSIYKTDNSFLLDSSDRFPDRLSAVVILDAADPATPGKLRQFILERNIVGLRLTGGAGPEGDYPWLCSDAAIRTWEVASEQWLPVALMYTPQGPALAAIDRIAALARRFPDVILGLDHLGWPGMDEAGEGPSPALRPLFDIPNVFFKATSINYRLFGQQGVDAARFVRRFADLVGAERMMWGSDFGNTLQTYAEMTQAARESAALLSPAERRQFLHGTAHRLYARTGR